MKPKYLSIMLLSGLICLGMLPENPVFGTPAYGEIFRIKSTSQNSSELMDLPFIAANDPEVKAYIKSFTQRGIRETEAMLGRAVLFFPVFEHYLKEAGLPDALKYLPVVESNLKPTVISYRGAGGLWQFMPATGRHYGLKIDSLTDERLDLHKSSAAAAKLLAKLHADFDDWFLVLAAYNCGPSRTRRAIKKAGSTEFEKVKPFLPKQTRAYTSKFIAAAYVANFYDLHQLEPRLDDQFKDLELHDITLEEPFELNLLSEICGVSAEQFRTFNPVFIKDKIPAGQYQLLLPESAATLLTIYLQEKREEEKQIKEALTAGESVKLKLNQLPFQHFTMSLLPPVTSTPTEPILPEQPQRHNVAVIRRLNLI